MTTPTLRRLTPRRPTTSSARRPAGRRSASSRSRAGSARAATGAEPNPERGRDLLDVEVGVLEQAPRLEHPLGVQPLERGGPGLGDEAAGERPRADRGAVGERGDVERLVEVVERPAPDLLERAAPVAGGQRALDELRLAALAMRRGDHRPRDAGRRAARRGRRGPGAGRGRCPRRGPPRSPPALVDVERVGFDLDPREAPRELVGVEPVRRRPAAVEEPGVGERERAGADRRHPRAAGGRGPQRLERRLGRAVVDLAVAGNDDRVGLGQRPRARRRRRSRSRSSSRRCPAARRRRRTRTAAGGRS